MVSLSFRGAPRMKLLCALVASCFAAEGFANPTGPSVVSGTASFNTLGRTLSVTNSPNAIINWRGFSIGAGETTRFQQQSAASAVLNRIVGQDPSAIFGTLSSNGKVFLINPNGILFGQGSRIDVAGLVASTLNLSDADFLAGKLNFQAGAVAAPIVNQGEIVSAAGGRIYLIAPDVQNHGLISSAGGEVVLAAGRSVKLVDADVPNLQVEVQAGGEALNVGQIIAQGGKAGIYAGLINQRGIVRADSVSRDATGRIVFRASDTTMLEAGSVTSASGAKGGEIQVLGGRVGLVGDARVDASGDSGGGTVLIGGDFQGKNAAVPNAYRTYFGADATIRADAITSGDGGKVIVWSDDATRAYGSISARGGSESGNGGFVEVSGKKFLEFSAAVDTRAPNGKTGTLLLDPTTIWIADSQANATSAGMGGTDTSIDSDASLPDLFAAPVDESLLTTGKLTASLATSNVTVATSNPADTLGGGSAGDINVVDPVSWSTAQTLTLLAQNNVNVNAEINAGAGSVAMYAGWNGASTATPAVGNSGAININQPVTAPAGNVVLIAGNSIGQALPGVITAAGVKAVAGSDVLLNQADNLIDVVAGSADNNSNTEFRIRNTKPLSIGTVDGTIGITTDASDGNSVIDINVTSGSLTVDQPVLANFGDSPAAITLTAAGLVNVKANVTSTNSSGTVMITGGSVTIGNGAVVSSASGGATSVQLTANNGGIIVQGGSIVSATSSTSGAATVAMTVTAADNGITVSNGTIQATGGNGNAGTDIAFGTDGGPGGASSIALTAGSGTGNIDLSSATITATGGTGGAGFAFPINTVLGGAGGVGGNATIQLSSSNDISSLGHTITATAGAGGAGGGTSVAGVAGGAGGAGGTAAVAYLAGGQMGLNSAGLSTTMVTAGAGGSSGASGTGISPGVTGGAGGDATITVQAGTGVSMSSASFEAIAAAGGAGGNASVAGANGTDGIATVSLTATGGSIQDTDGASLLTARSPGTHQIQLSAATGIGLIGQPIRISGNTNPQTPPTIAASNSTSGDIVISQTTQTADIGGGRYTISNSGSGVIDITAEAGDITDGSQTFSVTSPLILRALDSTKFIRLESFATFEAPDITLIADNMGIGGSVIAGSGTGTVRLQPLTPSRAIVIESPGTTPGLNLQPFELESISAGTLEIGRSTDTGTLTVDVALTSGDLNAATTTLKLANQNVVINQPITLTNANLALASGAGGAVSLGADLSVGTGSIDASTSIVNPTGIRTITGAGFSAGTLDVGASTTTLNANSSVDTLLLAGGQLGGTGTVTVNNSMSWTAGDLSGAGKLVVGPGATLTVSDVTPRTIFNGYDIDNQGTVTLTHSGTVSVSTSGQTVVTNTGTWNANQTAAFGEEVSGGSFRFNNIDPGAVIRNAIGTGTILNVTNDGLVHVQVGTLSIDNRAGFTSTGTFTIDSGATLQFVNGSHTINGTGSFGVGTGAGTLALANPTALNIGANVSIDDTVQVPTGTSFNVGSGFTASVATLSVNGGTLNGPGSLAITTDFTTTGGAFGTPFANLLITQATGDLTTSSFSATNSLSLTATTGQVTVNAPLSQGGAATLTGATGVNVNSPITTAGDLLLNATGPNADVTIAANITKNAGADATLEARAGRDVLVNSGVAISSSSNKLHVILNSDRDTTNGGRISMASGSSITSNGGNVTFGGGTDPLNIPAIGNAAPAGVSLAGATVNAGAGNVSIRGQGAAGTNNAYGVWLSSGATIQTTGIGSISVLGTGGAGDSGNMGILLQGSGTSISTVDGAITLDGTGAGTGTVNDGVQIALGAVVESTGLGTIGITGRGSNDPAATDSLGIALEDSGTIVRSTSSGAITLDGTGRGTSADNSGVGIDSGASVVATSSAPINIFGTGAPGAFGIGIGGNVTGDSGLMTLDATGELLFAGNGVGVSTTTGNQILTSSTHITLAPSGGSVAVGSGGTQTVTAGGNLTLTGGTGTGESAQLTSTGNQTIDVTGGNVSVVANAGGATILSTANQTLTLQGAGANALTVGSATSAEQSLIRGNNQQVTAGTGGESGSITVRGGTGAGKNASISNLSGTQSVSTTGTISLTGGTATGTASTCNPADSGSCAEIVSNAAALQTVSANRIELFGGSGGVANAANIRNNVGAAQIDAGSGGLHLQAGGGVSDNSASIGSGINNAQTITVNVVGDTTMVGGSTAGSGSLIGVGGTGDAQTVTVDFNGTGNLTLTGGSGPNGSAIGAGATATNTTTNLTIDAANITLNPGSVSGSRLGHSATNPGGGNIVVTATGTIALNSSGPGLGTSIRTLGNVTLNAASITQGPHSAIVAGGTTVLNGGSIALTSTNNDFTGPVSLNTSGANNVAISDANAIELGASNLGTGTLTVTAGGAITQSGAIVQAPGAGQATFQSTGGGAITLNANNEFTGPVDLDTTSSIEITDVSSFIIQGGGGVGPAPASLTINANGTVSQSAAFTGVAPALVLINAGSGPILLNDPANSFSGNTSITANATGAASLVNNDPGGIKLEGSSVGGALSLTSGGPVTQGAPVMVGGTSSINAGSNPITLTNASNNFGGAVSLIGSSAAITDVDALVLGTVSLGAGSFTVIALGGITQNGPIAAGDSSFTAGPNSITLDNGSNNFTGAVGLIGSSAAIKNAGALELGTVSLGGGSLDVTATGAITQNGAIVAGTSSFNAGANPMTLTNTLNDFTGPVSLTGTVVSITDANTLTLGAVNVSSLTVNALGLGQDASGVVVSGIATLNADSISLTSATNDFGTVVATSSGPVDLKDANAIALGATSAASLNVTAGGAVTQSGPISTGSANFNAGANPITLENTSNDFTGPVNLIGSSASITDANALALSTSTLSGSLVVNTSGAITQGGAISAGSASFNAGSNPITLTNAGNNFTGAVSLTGSTVAIKDANALTLGAVNAADLTVDAGTIGQDASGVVVGGTATLAANSIALATGTNDFGTVNVTSSGNVTLTDANSIVIDTVSVGGAFNIAASSTSFLNGFTASDYSFSGGSYTLAAGNYNLSGTTTISSSADVTAGSGVNLNAAGGTINVDGTLNASGGTVTTGTMNVAGTFNASSGTLTTTTTNVSGNFNSFGGTTMNVGTLEVLAGGMLSGTGTIQGTVKNTAGTVSPGGSPGILTINGSYVQTGGTLQMDIEGVTAGTDYDQLKVIGTPGTATLSGGTLSWTLSFAPLPGTPFTLIDTAGGISTSGTFAISPTELPTFNTVLPVVGPKLDFVVAGAVGAVPPPIAPTFNYTITSTEQLSQPLIELIDTIVVTYIVPAVTVTPEGTIVPKPPACN